MQKTDPPVPQKIKYSFDKILTGSDLSIRRLALMEAVSAAPGSVVWLTGCVHGDEVGGMVVIQEIFRRLRKTPLLSGSVHAFPLMNPIGFETMSRSVTPSKEDLNRSFPGNKNGSLAERIADKIFSTISATGPALVLDLHNDWIKSIPYTLIDPNPGARHKETYEKVKAFSQNTGFPVINEHEEGSSPEELRRTLTGSLVRHDIPALTIELGEAYIVNEKNVADGVRSVWTMLSGLSMTSPIEGEFNYQLPPALKGKVLRYSHQPAASTSGIVRFVATPGDLVEKGQPVAMIHNVFGKLQETLRAANDGVVLGHSDSSVALPGLPVVAFGIIDPQTRSKIFPPAEKPAAYPKKS